MPLLSIESNRELYEHDRETTLQNLSREVARLLGKSENYVMLRYQYNPNMLFAGSSDPLAYLEFKSLGLPQERTAELSATLSEQIARALSLPVNRVYIEFASPERHMWGWDGGTF